MTEPDIRKLNKLLETTRVIYRPFSRLHDVIPIANTDRSIYLVSSDGVKRRIDNLEKLFIEDFYVTIPITQVKQGLQPQ